LDTHGLQRASPKGIFRRWAIGAVIVAAIAGLLLIDLCAGNSGRASAPSESSSQEPATTAPMTSIGTAIDSSAPSVAVRPTVSEAVQKGVANATGADVEQAVVVIDRGTGQLLAGHAGDTAFNAESIGKLFTAAYYVIDADGALDAGLSDDLRALITQSNNDIQTSLWNAEIIPTIADRYQLTNTSNSAAESPNTWGSDQITADDVASFLYSMSRDPLVGPYLMGWMRATEPVGGDGFDQLFGFNALTGDHGSKQGWSDPGWSPANLHSVGWTDRYFGVILQTSPTATYATMRSTANFTAALVSAAR
jgi:hypothetical protein